MIIFQHQPCLCLWVKIQSKSGSHGTGWKDPFLFSQMQTKKVLHSTTKSVLLNTVMKHTSSICECTWLSYQLKGYNKDDTVIKVHCPSSSRWVCSKHGYVDRGEQQTNIGRKSVKCLKWILDAFIIEKKSFELGIK